MPLRAVPSYPLADALAWGVPPSVRGPAHVLGRLDLTRPDGPPLRLALWHRYWKRNGGAWYAKERRNGRSLTGYAGGHAPRGGGRVGLSAEGIAAALAGIDRQDRGPRPRCSCCGAILRAA